MFYRREIPADGSARIRTRRKIHAYDVSRHKKQKIHEIYFIYDALVFFGESIGAVLFGLFEKRRCFEQYAHHGSYSDTAKRLFYNHGQAVGPGDRFAREQNNHADNQRDIVHCAVSVDIYGE